MENNKNKKSVKFQGDMLNFYDFIQVFVFTTNHHLKSLIIIPNECSGSKVQIPYFYSQQKTFFTLCIVFSYATSSFGDQVFVNIQEGFVLIYRLCLHIKDIFAETFSHKS